jgi:hypothetical protein
VAIAVDIMARRLLASCATYHICQRQQLRIALLGPRMDALLGPRMDQEGLKATCPDGREAPISHASTSTAKKLKASFMLALSQSTAARWASRSLALGPRGGRLKASTSDRRNRQGERDP